MSGSEEERERTGKEFDVKVETVQQLETRIAIRLRSRRRRIGDLPANPDASARAP